MSRSPVLPCQLGIVSWSDGLFLSPWPSDIPLRGKKGKYNSGLGPSEFFGRFWRWERGCAIIPLCWKEMSQDPKLKWTRWKAWRPFYTEGLTSPKKSEPMNRALLPQESKIQQGSLPCTWLYNSAFALSPLENHSKAHSIFGKTRRN